MKLGKSAKRARQQNLPNTPRIAQSEKDSEELTKEQDGRSLRVHARASLNFAL
jgi:hypothetical protein